MVGGRCQATFKLIFCSEFLSICDERDLDLRGDLRLLESVVNEEQNPPLLTQPSVLLNVSTTPGGNCMRS